jgi:alcohol dehydrogenase
MAPCGTKLVTGEPFHYGVQRRKSVTQFFGKCVSLIDGRYNIPHGLAVSILLPGVMKVNMEKAPSEFMKLAEVLGEYGGHSDIAYTCGDGLQQVKSLLTKVGLSNIRLSNFGIKKTELESFAKDSENPDMSTNPAKLSPDEIISIYESLL